MLTHDMSSDTPFPNQTNTDISTPDEGFNEADDYFYIQMELCREQSLSDWIRNGKQNPDLDVQQIFRQILSAVEYLHNKVWIYA